MEDPHASRETSAEGNSAESADGTLVLLTGTPRETQTEPQNSLPLTPRSPIEGEPNGCKQEAADSVAAAGCMNGMVKMAEPMEIADVDLEKAALGGELAERAARVDEGGETDADVDRTALLGREPAERACGADKSDRMEREPQSRLQQSKLLCKETNQRNGNARENVPEAHGLPLKGEWLVCASGETTNSNGDADASSAATEHVNGPSESRETEDTMENKLRGCKEGVRKRESVDKADGSAGRGTGPADTSNELTEFVILSIESEDLGNGGVPRIRLGSMSWRADDANGPGSRADGPSCETDVLSSQADASRRLTDVLGKSTGTEMAGMSCDEGPGGAKCNVRETDGIGSHADTLTRQMHAPSVETDRIKPENETLNVRTRRIKRIAQNLPIGAQIETSKCSIRWSRVSIGNGDVYVPADAPIETASQMFSFGGPERRNGDCAEIRGRRSRRWRWRSKRRWWQRRGGWQHGRHD